MNIFKWIFSSTYRFDCKVLWLKRQHQLLDLRRSIDRDKYRDEINELEVKRAGLFAEGNAIRSLCAATGSISLYQQQVITDNAKRIGEIDQRLLQLRKML